MTQLVCIDCGQEHPTTVSRCSCGGALDRIEPLGPVDPAGFADRTTGIVRYTEALDLPRGSVTLGEGGTPLLGDDELGALLKCEHGNPTGSFKDRGAAAVVSRAAELGFDRVTEDSSGNAGAAVAAYAARAGLACRVFSPEHVTDAKRRRMETLGAEIEVVEGPRSKVTEAAHQAARVDDGTYYASHTYPPFFLDGCQSFAFEIQEALGEAPDAVVAPCAMGSVVLGVHRGFQRLEAAGAVDASPRLFAVQAAGCDPIAAAFGRGVDAEENRLADGLLVPEPPRRDQIVAAIDGSGGTAVSMTTDQTQEAMRRLHRRGVLVEPSSATALAGRDLLLETGDLDPDETAVLVLTGRWSP